MPSKSKQEAREKAKAPKPPKVVFPPKFDFFFHGGLITSFGLAIATVLGYLTGDIALVQLLMGMVLFSLPVFLYFRTFLFPNQTGFTRKQRQYVYIYREVTCAMPLMLF